MMEWLFAFFVELFFCFGFEEVSERDCEDIISPFFIRVELVREAAGIVGRYENPVFQFISGEEIQSQIHPADLTCITAEFKIGVLIRVICCNQLSVEVETDIRTCTCEESAMSIPGGFVNVVQRDFKGVELVDILVS